MGSLSLEEIKQIWAEAVARYDAGESLYLDAELESVAKAEQDAVTEQDEREGLVRLYLDELLPANWNQMGPYERRDFLSGDDLSARGTEKRQTVSNMEIWCECFGRRKEDLRPIDSYAIAAIMAKIPEWQKLPEPRRIPIYGKQRIYSRL